MITLLLSVLLAQEKAADDAAGWMRKMEEALAKARTLKARFTIEMKVGEESMATFEGDLALAEGNKLLLSVEGEMKGRARTSKVVSDGKEISPTRDGEPGEAFATPEKLNGGVAVMLARSGLVLGIDLAVPRRKDEEAVDLAEKLKVVDPKLGAKEKVGDVECQVVSYELEGGKGPGKVSVWIDAKRLLPLKRVITTSQGREEAVATETFKEILLDEKLDAKTFDRGGK
jgi:outer membrane lipoprotein-sorting protein